MHKPSFPPPPDLGCHRDKTCGKTSDDEPGRMRCQRRAGHDGWHYFADADTQCRWTGPHLSVTHRVAD